MKLNQLKPGLKGLFAAFGVLCMASVARAAEETSNESYWDPIANAFQEQKCERITAETKTLYDENGEKWYYVEGTVTNTYGLVLDDDARIILKDGANLVILAPRNTPGISVCYNDFNRDELHVYGQEKGSGRLEVHGGENAAGIGGACEDGKRRHMGYLYVYGGHVEAYGGKNAPGIGGSYYSDEYTGDGPWEFNLYGGHVKAYAGDANTPGVGGAWKNDDPGEVNLYGGLLEAFGGKNLKGIGAMEDDSAKAGKFTVNSVCGAIWTDPSPTSDFDPVDHNEDGYECTTSYIRIAAIEGVVTKDTGTLAHDRWYIVKGQVERTSDTMYVSGSAHLLLADSSVLKVTGGGQGVSVPRGTSFEIYGFQRYRSAMGVLEATSGGGAAGIGGWSGDCGTITINGGVVKAKGGRNGGAGIGGGNGNSGGDGGSGGTITINGGIVTATGGGPATYQDHWSGAGIGGGGKRGSGGIITINGGTVTAKAGDGGGAGIGGGNYFGPGGTITINGGTVTATGTYGGAGIGGGERGAGGKVTITGGRVTATGSGYGSADIGAGSDGDDTGKVMINGGIFGRELSDNWIVPGFDIAPNVDSQTRDDYPWIVLSEDDTSTVTVPTPTAGVALRAWTFGDGSVTNAADGTEFRFEKGLRNVKFLFALDPAYVMRTEQPLVRTIGELTDDHYELDVEFDAVHRKAEYVDETGTVRTNDTFSVVTEDTRELGAGWHLVEKAIELRDTAFTVTGDAKLILADGASLTVEQDAGNELAGIDVSAGNALTIYGQRGGTGRLTATGGSRGAGIGSCGANSENAGTITIVGGVVAATGGRWSPGIGGGDNCSGGTVRIFSGKVTAKHGPDHDLDIGRGEGGKSDGTIVISGGLFGMEVKPEWVAESGRLREYPDPSTTQDYPWAVVPAMRVTIGECECQTAAWSAWNGTETNAIVGTFFIVPSNTPNVRVIFTPVERDKIRIAGDPVVELGTVDRDIVFGEGNDYKPLDVVCTLGDIWYQDLDEAGGRTTNAVIRAGEFRLLTEWTRTLADGKWYVVADDVVCPGGTNITVNGAAHLILCDGASLTVNPGKNIGLAGIDVSAGNALTIYGQSGDTGRLAATGGSRGAGIGSCGANKKDAGAITIVGGVVAATGGSWSPGIGGGDDRSGGTVKICGGKVTAKHGLDHDLDIGRGEGGSSDGTIAISGGIFGMKVRPEWVAGGCMSRDNSDPSTKQDYPWAVVPAIRVTIGEFEHQTAVWTGWDGTETNAVGGTSFLVPSNAPNVRVIFTYVENDERYVLKGDPVSVIELGTVDRDIVFGEGNDYRALDVVCSLGDIQYRDRDEADGKMTNAVIRADKYYLVTDETRRFENGKWYVVADDVALPEGANITVDGAAHLILCDGASLTANSDTSGRAGIDVSEGNALTIYGQSGGTGRLAATGGSRGAGIGSCGANSENAGTITIVGGVVAATGGRWSPGIGGGDNYSGGTVRIFGGKVTAKHGPDHNLDIGRGEGGKSDGTIAISGGLFGMKVLDSWLASEFATAWNADPQTGDDYPWVVLPDADTATVTVPTPTEGVTLRALTFDGGSVTNAVDGTEFRFAKGTKGVKFLFALDPAYVMRTEQPLVRTIEELTDDRYELDVEFDATHRKAEYVDETGTVRTNDTFSVVTKDTRGLAEGWYLVEDTIKFRNTAFTVTGDAHLILADGASLTVEQDAGKELAGIDVSAGNALTIYGQREGTGRLTATGGSRGAGIGSCGAKKKDAGSITIAGGVITATGGRWCPGLGGGDDYSGGTVRIFGGKVAAKHGPDHNLDIGRGEGGKSDGTIEIFGGVFGMEIPDAWLASGAFIVPNVDPQTKADYPWAVLLEDETATVTVPRLTGVTLRAWTFDDGSVTNAAAGMEFWFAKGTKNVKFFFTLDPAYEKGPTETLSRTIEELTDSQYDLDVEFDVTHRKVEYVDETGSVRTNDTFSVVTKDSRGLGDGWYLVEDEIEFRNATFTVKGSAKLILADGASLTAVHDEMVDGAGIDVSEYNALTVYGQREGTGRLTATGGITGAGIGSCGINRRIFGSVTIVGGVIVATGGYWSAGIGGGDEYNGGSVKIFGGKVTAKRGYDGEADIGRGRGFGEGTIRISGGLFGMNVLDKWLDQGFFVVPNADPQTRADYPWKVLPKDETATVMVPRLRGVTLQAWTCGDGSVTNAAVGMEFRFEKGTKNVKAFFTVDEGRTLVSGSLVWSCDSVDEDIMLGEADVPWAKLGVEYVDENGQPQTAYADVLTSDMTEFEDGNWYAVTGAVEIVNGDHIKVSGSAHLILCDDSSLTVTNVAAGNAAIDVSAGDSVTSSLTIYGQSVGSGRLDVCGGLDGAGIGGVGDYGKYGDCGTVTVNGGTVTAKGGAGASGVGGGYRGGGGFITINGGIVAATGGKDSAGIGGGNAADKGSTVTINGGVVTATGGFGDDKCGGAGIGGGRDGDATVTISGGTVTAKGGAGAAGIGGGWDGDATVTIAGGQVTATGGAGAAGIGGGRDADKGSSVTIIEGTVTATGGSGGAGIGGGLDERGGTVTISGGTVTATGGGEGAGIGGGYRGRGGTVTISGGRVTAVCKNGGRGIGAGSNEGGGSIEIAGGTVEAEGWNGLANVLVDGGSVKSSSNAFQDPIGGQPTNSLGKAVCCVTVEVGDVEDGEKLKVYGLGDYGVEDIYPIDGRIYLYLPNGDYRFVVNGKGFAAHVGDSATTVTPIPTYKVTFNFGKSIAGVRYAVNGGKAFEASDTFTLALLDGMKITYEVTCEEGCSYFGMKELTVGEEDTAVDLAAERTEDFAAVDYCDEKGVSRTAYAVKSIYPHMNLTISNGNWYAISEDTTVGTLTVNGTANLILVNGTTLTVNGGVFVAGGRTTHTLNIYGQQAGTGRLVANGAEGGQAGIGQDSGTCGTVTINGGIVEANGGAGIGSRMGDGGTVTINGGIVMAKGADGMDIGGYASSGTVTINGGTVTANVMGIGPKHTTKGTVTINGGNVKACSIQPLPTNGVSRAVYPVTVVLPTETDATKPVTITGLADYGTRDVYPLDGNVLYLYLPDGDYTFAVDGAYYVAHVGGEACAAETAWKVTVTPIEGALITVKDADGNEITPDGNNVYSIPKGDFTVTYAPASGWKFESVTKNYNTGNLPADNVIDDSEDVIPESIVYVAQVASTDSEGVEKTDKFETVEEALQVVQAAEAAGLFPIVVTALAEDGLTITDADRTAKIAKGVSITITDEKTSRHWTVSGTLGYAGVIDGWVIADNIEKIDDADITLGKDAVVAVLPASGIDATFFTSGVDGRVVRMAEEDYRYFDVVAECTVTVNLEAGITAVVTNWTQGDEAKVLTASGSFKVYQYDDVSVAYTCSVPGYRPGLEVEGGRVAEDVIYESWKEAIRYTITYADYGAWVQGFEPTTEYTIESETFSLPVAENIEARTGATFRNWTNELGATVTEIQQGSMGNLVLYANWDTVTSPEQQAKDANVSGLNELPDQASKDKANANFAALYAELGSEPANVAIWTKEVYGEGGKIPAAKLAESNADLIKASANYNLAVMADPVTITPGATADGKFTFAIADADKANPVVADTKAQELMAYTSDLKTKFARDITGKAINAEVADGLIEVGFTGKDLEDKAANAGFMKVDLSVE